MLVIDNCIITRGERVVVSVGGKTQPALVLQVNAKTARVRLPNGDTVKLRQGKITGLDWPEGERFNV